MKNFYLSLLFVLIFYNFNFGQEPPTKQSIASGIGTGQGDGTKKEISKPAVPISDKTFPLRILSKSPASYTDTARENGVEGTVRLRVTFLASGEVGLISPVTSLPDGLTEQSIVAARKIKFEPAMKNDVSYSVTKLVEYNFSIYYRENDKDLAQNAEIIEMPEAQHPQESNLQNMSGKVKVSVGLTANGNAQIFQIKTDLPKEFVQKVTEAVAKIKFKPAIHKNGNAVTQSKEIEYEFSQQ